VEQRKIDDWREHPVTRALKAAIESTVAREREAVSQMLWSGNYGPETEMARMHVLVREEFLEDFFETDEYDLKAEMEKDG